MKKNIPLFYKALNILYLLVGVILLPVTLYAWKTNTLFAIQAPTNIMIKMRTLLTLIASLSAIACGLLGLLSASHKKLTLQCMAIAFLLLLIELTIFIINLTQNIYSPLTILLTLLTLILSLLYLLTTLKSSH